MSLNDRLFVYSNLYPGNSKRKLMPGSGVSFSENESTQEVFINTEIKSVDLQPINIVTFNDPVNIDLSLGNIYKLVLSGDTTITFSAPQSAKYILIIKQGVGGNDVTWPVNVLWAGGITPTLTQPANSVDVFSFYYDSMDDVFYAGSLQDLQ